MDEATGDRQVSPDDRPTGLAANPRNLWAATGPRTIYQLVRQGRTLHTPRPVVTGLQGPEGLAVTPKAICWSSRLGAAAVAGRLRAAGATVVPLIEGLAVGQPAPEGAPRPGPSTEWRSALRRHLSVRAGIHRYVAIARRNPPQAGCGRPHSGPAALRLRVGAARAVPGPAPVLPRGACRSYSMVHTASHGTVRRTISLPRRSPSASTVRPSGGGRHSRRWLPHSLRETAVLPYAGLIDDDQDLSQKVEEVWHASPADRL